MQYMAYWYSLVLQLFQLGCKTSEFTGFFCANFPGKD